MIDVVVILVIALILGLSAGYIFKSKKKGKHCVGCPDNCACSQRNCTGGCSNCKDKCK